MTLKERKYLIKLKSYVYKLKSNGQIPYSLYIEILNLSYESSIDYVRYLANLSEKYIRVCGFYIRHPYESYDCDQEIEDYKRKIVK